MGAILGHLLGWQIDSLFLTALLTVIGFSVHDDIVVFDRIRENSNIYRRVDFETVVNHSIVQTMDRSINTQLTVMITLLALALFGGDNHPSLCGHPADRRIQRYLLIHLQCLPHPGCLGEQGVAKLVPQETKGRNGLRSLTENIRRKPRMFFYQRGRAGSMAALFAEIKVENAITWYKYSPSINS